MSNAQPGSGPRREYAGDFTWTGDESGAARPVIEMEHGITVYPPEADGEPWRAVLVENGARRFRQGATEAKLAEKLEKVRERLAVEASNMERPGADLIAHYLGPDRLPVSERWSRKRAHTQGRLCALYVAPVIGAVTCQGITTGRMQRIVNAARRRGRANGSADDFCARHCGRRRRLPGELPAGESALAGR